jgi:aryl-alcohol dehydrogenase (NADP+)
MSFGVPGRGTDSWTLDEAESRVIIRQAAEAGINVFDTANVYSDGSSEEIVGRAIREYCRRDEVVLATKVFGPMHSGPNGGGLSRKSILSELDASLCRLGTDYVDLYQIHRWDPDTPVAETMETLHDAVRAGKVRYLGASSMWAWQFAKAQHTALLRGWTPFVSMQDYYNLIYREEEREMLPLCRDMGVGVLVWSPLARGRLARDWDAGSARTADDAFGHQLYAATQRVDRTIAGRLADVAAARQVPRAAIALAWLLRNPVVTAPIVGVTRLGQLHEALTALELELTPGEAAKLETDYVPHQVVALG